MDVKINTAVSPEVHPNNTATMVDADGHVADNHTTIQHTRGALAAAYETLSMISDAQLDLDAIQRTGGEPINFAEDVLHRRGLVVRGGRAAVARSADEQLIEAGSRAIDLASAKMDKAMSALKAQEAAYDKAIDDALVDRTYASPIAIELRAHYKAMAAGDRLPAIVKAVREGDTATAAAVLKAPAVLSGLDQDQQQLIRNAAAEAICPALLAQREAARRGQQLIMRAGRHVMTALADLAERQSTPRARAAKKIAAVKALAGNG